MMLHRPTRLVQDATRRSFNYFVIARRHHRSTPPSTSTASSSSAATARPTPKSTSGPVDTSTVAVAVGTLGPPLWRLACAFGLVYVTTEYCVELTICEGPSMMPTIQPRGEVVLMDRWTPRWWGLQGGSDGDQRAALARSRQRHHVRIQNQEDGRPTYQQTWYEPRIPVNRLPRRIDDDSKDEGPHLGSIWDQLTTGVSVGDVVVLQHPDRVGTVCKRVLGLPGDVVTKPTTRRGATRLLQSQQPPSDNLAQLKRHNPASSVMTTVPDGHLWVEGDNPWNSSDSRNYGPVPASLIVGRVLFRIWPLRGDAWMLRGDRPIHDDDENDQQHRPSLAFSGSVVFPAGYRNQIIVRDYEAWKRSFEEPSSAPNGQEATTDGI